MAEIKGLVDNLGVIHECNKVIPEKFKLKLVEVLAELEDNECHKTNNFPKSELHKIEGVKKYIEHILIKFLDGDCIFNMEMTREFIFVRC